jgi:uncharacterized protein (DUF697 family)
VKNLDNDIRDIFGKQLANHESEVRPELWKVVQSKMAAQAAPAPGMASIKLGLSKAWVAALIAAGIVAGFLAYKSPMFNDKKQNSNKTSEEQSMQTATEQAAAVNEEQNTAQEDVAAQPIVVTQPDDS